MNAFLAALRHTMDDIPLRLFATEAEAWHFAAGVGTNDGEREKDLLVIDASTPVCVAVYTFEAGLLSSCTIVKSFDGDERRA